VRRVLALLFVAVVAVSCSRSDAPEAPRAFCVAARRYEKELERQASKNRRDIPRQIELVEQLYETAPPAIRRHARTFLDAMRHVQDDPSVRDNPKIKEAVDDVNRYAAQGCDVYQSNQSPGGI